jgi:arabinofuranosyltransferase
LLLERKHSSNIGFLASAVFLLYLFAIVRKAWIGDDAFITLRAVDNFVHGYGLLSNPPERVQGFTNVLWAFVLAIPCWLGINGYWAAIGTGLVTSAAAAGWLATRATSIPLHAALALVWLVSSQAYVEFSTSGLENPLSHLLLVIFFVSFIRNRLDAKRITTWLWVSLITLDRYDQVLLVIPPLVALVFRGRGQEDTPAARWKQLIRSLPAKSGAMLLGLCPLVIWFGFSISYYGFPFPNTAYAKLNAVIPRSQFVLQGIWYIVDSLKRDPITLLVVAFALVEMVRDRTISSFACAGGILLYLTYVVFVGGDFMAGRFLTSPFIIAVTWMTVRGLSHASQGQVAAIAGASAVLGLIFSDAYNVSDKFECPINGPSGIVSERLCYAELTGLSENIRIENYKTHRAYKRGVDYATKKLRTTSLSSVGMSGYAAGPGVHIVDTVGLTDPLLARIPYRPKPNVASFRIGHFWRDVPEGYETTIATGHNVINDPCLRAYYDRLNTVIRGPLFTKKRWKAIVDLNFGKYDYLMAQPCPLLDSKQGSASADGS